MHPHIFITGTHTDIGKTLVSAMLLSAALQQGIQAHYFKPIQTGRDCDCTTVKELTQAADTAIQKPLFSFALPAAPYTAARAEKKEIHLQPIQAYIQSLQQTSCIVEGAGGLLVPIAENIVTRDLILALGMPLLIVASTALGTINHTLLTIEAALSKNIQITGIVLSGKADASLRSVFKKYTAVPVLAEIPWLENISADKIKEISPFIFNKKVLEKIFICPH
jgi:dethiobiotin synthase